MSLNNSNNDLGGSIMKQTKGKLRELTEALKHDFSEIAEEAGKKIKQTAHEVKEGASLRFAESVGHVRNEGLGNIVSKAVKRAAAATGKAVGYVERTGEAAYKAVVSTKKKPGEPTQENGNVAERATSLYQRIKTEFDKRYSASAISPEKVAAKFEEAAKYGIGVVGELYQKLREGTDRASKEFCKYIPTDADYLVGIGRNKVQISRAMLTKPQIESVRDYLTKVSESLPQNCRGRNQILTAIAEQGIRSHREFKEKAPDVYTDVKRYLKR